MKERFSGKFIVLDGPDGCGKSTQAGMLAKWLKKQGVKVVSYRDPGTTKIGEKIRRILLNPAHDAMDVNTEVLLYMAARAQLWSEKIKGALDQGKCVLMDRWISSTCAYQGHAGGFGLENVVKVGQICLERLWPDLTVVLDVNIETAAKRMDRALDRMEQKSGEYHEKVREGYLELAVYHDRVVVIDADATREQVHDRIVEALEKRF